MGGKKGPIQAAGAVVLRERTGADGRPVREVLVVHRPGYDDVSLPKGKQEADEELPTTAVREVAEETGVAIRLGAALQPVEYSVRVVQKSRTKTRAKIVSWWVGIPLEQDEPEDGPRGTASPEEVDGVSWVPADVARQSLTYPTDVQVLEEALGLPPTSTVVLVRHGKAVSRKDWQSRHKHRSDASRPLERRGKRQARALVALLSAYGVRHLTSSSSVRCMQTLAPYADAIGVEVVGIDELSEEAHANDPDLPRAAMRRIVGRSLSDPTTPIAVCGHRPVLPIMRDALGGANRPMSTAECLVVHLDEAGRTVRQEWYRSNF